MALALQQDGPIIKRTAIDLDDLRTAIQDECALVANEPEHGFHFLVGRPLAQLLGYQEARLAGVPEPTCKTKTPSSRLRPRSRTCSCGPTGT
jgi:hypothetical protein